MPVYNGMPYLPETLDCLIAQTDVVCEIIVVDDGSEDETLACLNSYAERDPRLKVLACAHRGIVPSLNEGLAAATGAYIARMDGDDLCVASRLQKQAAFLDVHREIGLVASHVIYGGDPEAGRGFATFVDWTNRLETPEQIQLFRFVESPLVHPSVMFRREVIEQVGPYRDGDFPEDYELWLRMLDHDVAMAKVPEALVTWRERPNRLSRVDDRYAVPAFYRTKSQYLAKWVKRQGIDKVMVWGAGRPTRRRAELIQEHGIEISAWIDVDPKKIGQTYDGKPCLAADVLADPQAQFVLSYVGNRGAREDIRQRLESRGFVMGRHFLLAA
jgi:glycosyltransferase involved in cell wall biosynthesis